MHLDQPFEGGLFPQGQRAALILQNAFAEARRYDPSQGAAVNWPRSADLFASSDLTAAGHLAAAVTALNTGQPVDLPPYSLARLIWE